MLKNAPYKMAKLIQNDINIQFSKVAKNDADGAEILFTDEQISQLEEFIQVMIDENSPSGVVVEAYRVE